MFDQGQFLAEVTNKATSTVFVNVPEAEYIGVIEDLSLRTVKTKDGDRQILRCKWSLMDDDGALQRATGREKNSANQDLWLDLDDNGKLLEEEGQNVGLGRLREALGQNEAGQSWNPNMLIGVPGKPVVTHRVSAKDGQIFAEIKSVLPIG